MKTTDYAKIAHKYEKNQYRFDEVKFDDDLKTYIDHNPQSTYQVLDLACGIGIYLENQIKNFDKFDINWYGLDASEEMLSKAKEKLEHVTLLCDLAENLPCENESFDYISNNYAFHHFLNKGAVLDEVYRVLRQNGVYRMHNIAIHNMKNWWVYHYFPTAYEDDLKRFWEKEVIFNELSSRGFEVNLRMEYRLEKVKVSDYLEYAENREISILTLISDQDYQEGLEKMRDEVKINPDKTIVNDFAEMFCISRKM
ncbi:class I SAM-dependent methyltransferase [Gracilibacillus alcaliphilus]|uniref:class I SAM-dependent methyltransferase n=1 Tax=Gracilibacillus alcaliphilus TaxID=1401441 RepID=UPI00195DAFBE|nr:class I SAM-dependent methyltransferase [Gracilibacillus alcaliphilus]MBM7677852.1 ubiquinone/menaquinone biosynthesis C-methylase UbiE [Gracilibacillus alcaliphilus]